jgi:hypothetical protein
VNAKILVYLSALGSSTLLGLLLGVVAGILLAIGNAGSGTKEESWELQEVTPRTREAIQAAVAEFDAGYQWSMAALQSDEDAAAAAARASAASDADTGVASAEEEVVAGPAWRFVGITNEASRGEVVALVSIGKEIVRREVGEILVDNIEILAIDDQSIKVMQNGEVAQYNLYHRPVPLEQIN